MPPTTDPAEGATVARMASIVAAGTITQAMLDDPNSFLRKHIALQTITSTTVSSVSTAPASPLFGGGTDNVAFLLRKHRADGGVRSL
jgi:hypothetical protein